MVANRDRHEPKLDRLAALKQSLSRRQDLRPSFGPLQWLALTAAACWLVLILFASHKGIQTQLDNRLRNQQLRLHDKQIELVHVFEQNLHQAEQLSKTLSYDSAIIQLVRTAKNRQQDLNLLTEPQRYQLLTQVAGANAVNRLMSRLATDVGINQVFLQDSDGYCIASASWQQEDSCVGYRYWSREYFQEARAWGNGRQFAIGRQIPLPSFFFSSAIHENGQFLGVIIVRMLTDEVINFVTPDNAHMLITDNNGVIIHSSLAALRFAHIGEQFAPVPEPHHYREIYKRETMDSLAIQPAKLTSSTEKLWQWDDNDYLLSHSYVRGGDFQMYLFQNIKPQLAEREKNWRLSIVITIAGLLAIFLLERNLQYNRQRKHHLAALSAANLQLTQLSEQLYELTVTDALTGVSSRRYFSQRLQDEIGRQQRRSVSKNTTGLALLMVDIDKFKRINDTYGHPAGDEAIGTMAKICRELVRPYDLVGRMGGEEFAILLRDADQQQATDVAGRILKKCAATTIEHDNRQFRQTCSIGVALYQPGDTTESLLSSADKALYSAKNSGRNRFVVQQQAHD